MLNRLPRTVGFTLIEMLVGLAILSLLFMLALPSFTQFLANTQVRNAAESILAGLRNAQSAAIKRNSPVEFVLEPGEGWKLRDVLVPAGEFIQSQSLVEGAKNSVITATPSDALIVTFGGLGRIVANQDGGPSLESVEVASASMATARRFRVFTGAGAAANAIRLCDRDLPSSDPKSCP